MQSCCCCYNHHCYNHHHNHHCYNHAPVLCHTRKSCTLSKPAARASLMTWCVGAKPAFLRHGPQLQHRRQPSPQVPRQVGQTQMPLASARTTSSPWRLRKHILLCNRDDGDHRSHTIATHQKEVGMRLPLPQLGWVQVTWSSNVFWRHQWQVTPYLES